MYLKGVNKYKNTFFLKGSFIVFFGCIFFVFSFLINTFTKKIQVKKMLKVPFKRMYLKGVNKY